jgi:2-acylglycerol O-acyltransferase 2
MSLSRPSFFSRLSTRVAITGLLPGMWCLTFSVPVCLALYSPVPGKYLLLTYGLFFAIDYRKPFNGGRSNSWFRRSHWFKLISDYHGYNLKLEDGVQSKITRATEDSGRPIIFNCHPHGVMSAGPFNTFVYDTKKSAQRLFPKMVWRVMTINATFYTPIWREFMMSLGFIDASRKSSGKALDKGYSLVLVPGGAAEALLGSHYEPELILNKRKGFCKLALQHNVAALVPCFTFGENELFDHVNVEKSFILTAFRKFMSLFGVTVPFLLNIVPRRKPVTTVMGPPVCLNELKSGSEEERIEELHAAYVAAIEGLYERHRKTFNYGELKIVA